MAMIGVKSRLSFVFPNEGITSNGLHEVDIYAAGRWLTCEDSNAHLPTFVNCMRGELDLLLDDGAAEFYRRPYPDLSPADNHRRLRAEAKAGENDAYLRYRFLDWGPTTDNVSAHLFLADGVASIPFSFPRPGHHDPSERGQVFVAELPERELVQILHKTAWALAIGIQ